MKKTINELKQTKKELTNTHNRILTLKKGESVLGESMLEKIEKDIEKTLIHIYEYELRGYLDDTHTK